MSVDLQQLRTFVAVSREGNVARGGDGAAPDGVTGQSRAEATRARRGVHQQRILAGCVDQAVLGQFQRHQALEPEPAVLEIPGCWGDTDVTPGMIVLNQ
jgi:hypothetical protein